MADIADQSDDLIQTVIDAGIAAVRKRPGSGLISCGYCHWCQSPVTSNRLFCADDSCAADWEHERRRRQDTGAQG